MDILSHLEAYINAQKSVGTHFILIGALLLLVAGWSHFSVASPLNSGLKLSSLVCGLLILMGGFCYRYTETSLLKNQTELFQKSKDEFRRLETKRMVKVKKDYPIYQRVFSAVIVAALLLILLVKNPYWHGIAFAVIILMVGIIIVEAYSQQSINSYFEQLTNK